MSGWCKFAAREIVRAAEPSLCYPGSSIWKCLLTHTLQVPQPGDHRGCGTGQLEGRRRRLAQLSVERTQQSAVTSHSGEQHRLPSYYSGGGNWQNPDSSLCVASKACARLPVWGGLESCVFLYFMAQGCFFFFYSFTALLWEESSIFPPFRTQDTIGRSLSWKPVLY